MPGVLVSVPPHPGHVHSEETHGRDPHNVPEFSSTTLTHLASPILYLPPLLSSLPQTHPTHRLPETNPPLHTSTHLPDIDPVSLSLHKALHRFRPVDSEYSRKPYAEAFNWGDLELPEDEEREWYCVAFRSLRKVGSDSGRELFTSRDP